MAFLNERYKSFKYAFAGISYAFRTQPNIRIHSLAALLVLILGFFLRLSVSEWLIIVLAIGFVLTAEMFNSSIEKLVDMVSPERREKAGIVKDIAAGAVLVASIMALILGCIIFIPKILHLFLKCSA